MSSEPKGPTRKRKRKRSRYPYTTKEKTLVWLCCIQITFAVWALGLTALSTQIIFASLSAAGLVFCLLPQFYSLESLRDPRLSTLPVSKRLIKYPIFWAGLGLVIYMILQWVNPAYLYVDEGETWKAVPIDHVEWLPSSVQSPLEKHNPLRLIIIFTGPWLMLCYLKLGVIRRNSLIRILWVITFNMILLGIVTIYQKQVGFEKIYGVFEAFPNFVGSIPYKNHGAAAINLGMVLMMTLYFLHLKALRMELNHSGPHLVVLLAIVFCYGLLWTTQSRGGVLIGSALLIIFLLFTFIPSLRDGSTLSHKVILGMAMVFMGITGILYTQQVPDREATLERFGDLREEIQKIDSNARALSTSISIDMFEDRWLWGWGAASWRYVFPYYQINYPEIKFVDEDQKEFAVWKDAHNDWAQYLSELGIVGILFLVAFFTWPLLESILVIRAIHLSQVILNLGLISILLHAIIDLLLQNQMILCLIFTLIFFINRLNTEQLRAK
jgi:hypothetical protein